MKRFSLRPRRRFALRSLALASLMWLGTGIQASPGPFQPTEAEAASSGRRTAAYVYDRAGLQLRDSDAPHLDQLNYSFALIQNGEVSGSHWQSIDVFRRYVERHPHILPVLAIGGWGADGFSQAASTADGRARFVDSTLVLMERHGFLGVDIDWEYPGSSAAGIASSANDRKNFTLLLQALREGLDSLTAQDGKPRMLAVALGGDPWHQRELSPERGPCGAQLCGGGYSPQQDHDRSRFLRPQLHPQAKHQPARLVSGHRHGQVAQLRPPQSRPGQCPDRV